jgi:hypothetical protein
MEWSQRHILISRAKNIGSLVHKFIKEWIQTDGQTDNVLPRTKSPMLLPVYNVRGVTIVMRSLCVEMTFKSTSFVLVFIHMQTTFSALRDRLSFRGSRPSTCHEDILTEQKYNSIQLYPRL